MGIPITRIRLAGHQAGGRGIIVIVIGPSGVTVTAVKLSEYPGVTIRGEPALGAQIEDGPSIDCDAERVIQDRRGQGGDRRSERNSPPV